MRGTTRPALHKDVIQLSTREATEKLAVSFALAQSAKLGVFEVCARGCQGKTHTPFLAVLQVEVERALPSPSVL
eukprot:scaffold5989_cov84-Isochrysis_galbana.AAC.1